MSIIHIEALRQQPDDKSSARCFIVEPWDRHERYIELSHWIKENSAGGFAGGTIYIDGLFYRDMVVFESETWQLICMLKFSDILRVC